MNLKIFQKGFNYSQDGQGNRLVFHLQGCNMKCPWCSNPEGMAMDGTTIKENGRRRLSCKEYSVEDIIKEAIRSKPMFFDGGGVTLTGGEITMQFEAVKELLEKLGEAGIHRAIETNGSHPRTAELITLVDQWIMDVKHYDDKKHQEWVGVSLKNTTQTLETASNIHEDMLIRVPLIPGFNDSKDDAEAFAKYFVKHTDSERVKIEFLAYHEFGKGKWEQCGLEYKMPQVKLEPGTVTYFEKIMAEHGITCVRT